MKNIFKERRTLPIYGGRKKIINTIKSNATTIIIGETGCGKTTQVPQYIWESKLLKRSKNKSLSPSRCMVGITQPRRVAAITLSNRVAEEMNSGVGELVGYSIRFDDRTSKKTRVKFMTDGILLREAMLDPLLSQYRIIVLDEAHERTVNTDILLALLKRIQKKRFEIAKKHDELNKRNTNNKDQKEELKSKTNQTKLKQEKENKKGKGTKKGKENKNKNKNENENEKEKTETNFGELKIVVMSATLDADQFSEYFNFAPVLYVSGRQHPIDLYYLPEPEPDYLDTVLTCILQCHLLEKEGGDILAFLTGQEEIEMAKKLLKRRARNLPISARPLEVRTLFSALHPDKQMRAFGPTKQQDARKVILSTNIAETSVTITGVRIVVDSGLVKQKARDSKAGIDRLEIVEISKESARQRMGRAGRENTGKCFRIYTEDYYHSMKETRIPEIQRTEMADILLKLIALGIPNIFELDLIDKPKVSAVRAGLKLLLRLKALNKKMQLTSLGDTMSKFPCHPMLASVLIKSAELGCLSDILTVVSLLSVQSIFFTPRGKREKVNEIKSYFASEFGDHITYLNVFETWAREGRSKKWCTENFINWRSMRRVILIRQQLQDYCVQFSLMKEEECLNLDEMRSIFNKISGNISKDKRVEAIRKTFCYGFFTNYAELQTDKTYKTSSGKIVKIHPSSVLSQIKPPSVIFNELVKTKNDYIRDVMSVRRSWVDEAVPNFLN
ncbi:atp-dependent RNA helicase dhx33 [Anaeramoeba flamelloides]|uniref:RNA helicase n=1 Tax=Anaeramoeba flamelloides TaxID=1746091 RepID=A0AAV8A560_9EUKA|nr:atp-dependent RNA helicase dhx33 [Anaeramoeba flamelloides]